MGRRTKDELIASNYYKWLEVCNVLRAKKKEGVKLSANEKSLMRNIPTPENPFKENDSDVQTNKAIKKEKKLKAKIDFDENVVWPEKGNNFLCAVYNVPYSDEQCLLFCEKKDCPFFAKGYFRSHGIKF